MKYSHVQEGVFIERINRFTARARLDGQEQLVHVKNTGRLQELLTPGAGIFLQKAENPNRKTRWDLISVKKGNRIINIDSQVCNKVVQEFLESGKFLPAIRNIRPEMSWGSSRFDFYLERENGKNMFLEVKGITLESGGIAAFPDAPTIRGTRHVRELMEAVRQGYEAGIFFVLQMSGIHHAEPFWSQDPDFCQALREADRMGIHIYCYDSLVTEEEIVIAKEVPFLFSRTFRR